MWAFHQTPVPANCAVCRVVQRVEMERHVRELSNLEERHRQKMGAFEGMLALRDVEQDAHLARVAAEKDEFEARLQLKESQSVAKVNILRKEAEQSVTLWEMADTLQTEEMSRILATQRLQQWEAEQKGRQTQYHHLLALQVCPLCQWSVVVRCGAGPGGAVWGGAVLCGGGLEGGGGRLSPPFGEPS